MDEEIEQTRFLIRSSLRDGFLSFRRVSLRTNFLQALLSPAIGKDTEKVLPPEVRQSSGFWQ